MEFPAFRFQTLQGKHLQALPFGNGKKSRIRSYYVFRRQRFLNADSGETRIRNSSVTEFSSLVRDVESAIHPKTGQILRSGARFIQNNWRNIFDVNFWVVEDFRNLVRLVNGLEPLIAELSDSQLKERTVEFRRRLGNGETLDDIQAEAFAVVREAAKRTLGLRHFDVQIIGGGVLHAGAVAEMQTGEGKTLVSTLAAYLNALTGQGVHVVTVNDYLAKRDADWVGKVHRFLGLSVGCLQTGMSAAEKREQYRCDITYAQNNEIGWDYLRDNLKVDKERRVMRWPHPFHFALIDEIDSVVIDEGRNPLLISKVDASRDAELFEGFLAAASIASSLVRQNQGGLMFTSEAQFKTISLTETGANHAAMLLDNFLKDSGGAADFWAHSYSSLILKALKAEVHYLRDRDYLLLRDEASAGGELSVKLLDEVSGRAVDKKWMHGIQQAVEAKEYLRLLQSSPQDRVLITPVQKPAARVAWQALVGMYPKRAGMTGTAKTEEREFLEGLGMPVVVVPTNRPCQRKDLPIQVHCSKQDKWRAVMQEAYHTHLDDRPVLIGTTSVSDSQELSDIMKGYIPHAVLNAKPENAAREAELVAQAGRRAMVTISTNMAGRGTDILLGGNPEMLAKGVVMDELRPWLDTNGSVSSAFSLRGMRPIPLAEEARVCLKACVAAFRLINSGLRMTPSEVNKVLELILDSSAQAADQQLQESAREPLPDPLSPPPAALLASEAGPLRWQQQKVQQCLQVAYCAALLDTRRLCRRESEVVRRKGGLHVIGSELQTSRRIDNQLKGRAGRQGDPGSTRFIISLEDSLFLEQLGGANLALARALMDDEGLTAPALSAQLLWMQSHVDGYYQSWRREQAQFEEIQEGQRLHVYGLRQHVLESSQEEAVKLMKQYIQAEVDEQISACCSPSQRVQQWRLGHLLDRLNALIVVDQSGRDWSEGLPDRGAGNNAAASQSLLADWAEKDLLKALLSRDESLLFSPADSPYLRRGARWARISPGSKLQQSGEEYALLRFWLGSRAIQFYDGILKESSLNQQRRIALDEIDEMWTRHLVVMERLLSGVKIRGYAFVEPMEEYRIDTTRAFAGMLRKMLRNTVVRLLNQRLEGIVSAEDDGDS